MRSESAGLLDAIDEVLALGRDSGARCQISHLKASGRANWGQCEAAMAKIEDARREGVDIAADRYPYTAGATELDIILPDWAVAGGRERTLDRLRDRGQSRRLAAALDAERSGDYWSSVMVGAAFSPQSRLMQGLTVAEIAERWGVSPGGAVCRLLQLD